MRYMLTLHATDIMDQIHVTYRVSEWDGKGGAPDEVIEKSSTYPGVGEPDVNRWIRDALVQALEL